MKVFCFLLLFLPLSLIAQNNVGIGTTAPLSKLDIKALGDGAELLRFTTDRPWVFKQSSTGVLTRLTLQSTVNDKAFDILSENGLNRAAEFLSNNSYSRVMLVPDGGEVGIGVDDALGKLHVSHNSTGSFPQLRLTEEDDDFARIKFESSLNQGAYWDIAAKSDTITNNSRLNFYFSNSTNSGDRMTISGFGDVGIGTTVPEAKLDIVGGDWNLDDGNPGDLRIGSSPANAFRIGVATGGGGAGIARLYSQGGSLILGTNNTPRMSILTSGDVGIGTTSPLNKLQVQGDASSTNTVFRAITGYSGNSNIIGIEGFSSPAIGYGTGGSFTGGWRGIRAYAQGTSSSGLVIAVEASAYGTNGTRTGLFGRAIGGSTNWAGYFAEGNVYVTNELRIGSGALSGAAGYKVAVDGKIIAEELRIKLSQNWPDYVFEETYKYPTIPELSEFVKNNKHLPGVPTAAMVKDQGILLGEMQSILLEKIEELTLHIIQLNERIIVLENRK